MENLVGGTQHLIAPAQHGHRIKNTVRSARETGQRSHPLRNGHVEDSSVKAATWRLVSPRRVLTRTFGHSMWLFSMGKLFKYAFCIRT